MDAKSIEKLSKGIARVIAEAVGETCCTTEEVGVGDAAGCCAGERGSVVVCVCSSDCCGS